MYNYLDNCEAMFINAIHIVLKYPINIIKVR